MKALILLTMLTLLFNAPLVSAEEPRPDEQENKYVAALKKGSFSSNLRYRFENVDQSGFLEDAVASTLRTRVGYRTGEVNGMSFFVEFEDLRVIGSSDFNDTKNGKTQFPVVADPDDTELNQFYFDVKLRAADKLRLGRQRINLNNQRFFGAVGFRQNEQTFDAVRYEFKAGGNSSGVFGHISNANRVLGDHHPVKAQADTKMSTQFAEVAFNIGGVTITGFTHFLDFDDIPLASHRNLGVRLEGKNSGETVTFKYYFEYADQSDHADGASTVDADYWHAVFDVGAGSSSFGMGYELLGGDGVYAFQAPLGTLHKFNGWADVFLTTPVDGLEDVYVFYGFKKKQFSAGLVFHDYSADNTSASYGDELDFFFGYQVNRQLGLKIEYADYNADTFSADTRKIWLSATHAFN